MNEMSSGQFVFPSGSLPQLASDELARLLIAACDIVLVIDPSGKIVDLSLGAKSLKTVGAHSWIGQSWRTVVAADSAHKVDELIAAKLQGLPEARQINHVLPDGRNRLIEYQLLNFSNRPNRIAVGRDFGALEQAQQQLIDVQHLMEREHHYLRQCETRYRALLQASAEAFLVVDGRNEQIIEANAAAATLLGTDCVKIANQRLSQVFDKEARDKVSAALSNAFNSNVQSVLRLDGDDDRSSLTLNLSRFRAGDATQLLVKLTKDTPALREEVAESAEKLPEILGFFQNALDALVVTDTDGRIISANSAFVNLVEMPEIGAVKGQVLSAWLGRQPVDFQVIMTSLRDKQWLKLFRTEMIGQFGSFADVELCAQVNTVDKEQTYGFCIRNISRRPGAVNDDSSASMHNPRELAEFVGRVPLKNLVRESTEVIEKLAIEEALRKTGNNRASAAELLGVSRQSLYVKLRRYGFDSAVDASP